MDGQIIQHVPALRHLWLELTGRCNLTCSHCYAGSSPTGDHGTMSKDDWLRVIDQANDLRVGTIQFIGGEPTLHPDFMELLERAAVEGTRVEVFSNLASIREEHWATFERLNVSVATSFYSADAATHDRMTGRRGSQSRTLRNIQRAVTRGISLRVGVISQDDRDDDRIETGKLLARSGVTDITWDRVRGVGRGETMQPEPSLAALCGNCASSSAAVMPNGDVFPCVMARSESTGNVRFASLADVLSGTAMQNRLTDLRNHFARRKPYGRALHAGCGPESCGPDACNPSTPPPPCPPFSRFERPDRGRPVDIDPYKQLPLKDKIMPKVRVPKINPEKNKPN